MNLDRVSSPSPSRQAYERSFAGRRFNWLQQIASDRDLPLPALHVAVVLANKLHSKPGEHFFTAWLFQETIAAELDVSDRAVRTSIAALKKRGYLTVIQRGHHQSAIYKPLLKPDETGTDLPASEQSDRNETSGLRDLDRNVSSGLKPSDRKFCDSQTGIKLPGEEDDEEDDLREEDESATKTKGKVTRSKNGRRRPQTSPPEGFHLSADLEEYAARTAGWKLGRASAEFDRFLDYWRSKGALFADWDAAWRNWVRKGTEIDKRNQPQTGITIDEHGNQVQMPPPTRQPYRPRSHLDLLFEDDGR
ncbi:hypothetical protein ACE102_03170 [Bradyrhizobium sp. vgs-9]|uniref:hypothetical protein n=1 Tax=Bradyrhizobium sp. vgs-9 TaxID=208389 RepID=UPI0035D4E17F